MSELPIDTAADVEELRATEAFTLLGSETRLAILLALWEADELFDDGPPNPSERQALSFSELRERVDYDTSSNFSYHLDQLLGSFVRKTDDGYELLPAGDNIVHAIVASAGFVDRTVPPMGVDHDCPRCGRPGSARSARVGSRGASTSATTTTPVRTGPVSGVSASSSP